VALLIQPPVPLSLDHDPSDRSFDRQLAHLGLLDDAAPLFRDGTVGGLGVLVAVPCLIESGVFRISRKLYGEIGPAFYGLRTTLLTLLLMALLRIKRPEHLKEKDPAALGPSPGARPGAGGQGAPAPADTPRRVPLRRATGYGAGTGACQSTGPSHGTLVR
jgi:hypothetical protein